MGDAMAVLVRRTLERFRRRDLRAGFEVEDFLAG
jgi:hypothetical protein